ncbi:hypothetical protein ElyMa_000725100 [Elysia marginata]|uniref:Uncharacterized protein n=1 Tax=Elysia marginata TaxID=1093978 RepID=A0AAV4GNE9_9GAST|nr:hypothetical protein ElyMa_000725100 [Elysia marginata]
MQDDCDDVLDDVCEDVLRLLQVRLTMMTVSTVQLSLASYTGPRPPREWTELVPKLSSKASLRHNKAGTISSQTEVLTAQDSHKEKFVMQSIQ